MNIASAFNMTKILIKLIIFGAIFSGDLHAQVSAVDTYAFRNRCPSEGDQFIDQSNFYGCECTSFAAQHLRDHGIPDFSNTWKGGGFHNASTWLDGAKTVGIPYDNLPRVGDIAYWKSDSQRRQVGAAGHVAVVQSVNPNGTVNVTEYNIIHFDFQYKESVAADSYIHFPVASSNSNATNTDFSYFDGAGSLVRPNENCWGCNKDEATMHPRVDHRSTVVFQWLYDQATCEHVDVQASPDIGVALVRTRSWSAREMSSAFASATPVSIPSQGMWTIFSITSERPLTSQVSIKAYCRPPGTVHVGNRVSFTKDQVALGSDYYWSGNGSLISQSSSAGFGATQDLAITYPSNRSLAVFQWYRSARCPKVVVADSGGSPVVAAISMKSWNEKDFGADICNKLPCKVNTTQDAYYLLKVKAEAGAINSGMLSATCSN